MECLEFSFEEFAVLDEEEAEGEGCEDESDEDVEEAPEDGEAQVEVGKVVALLGFQNGCEVCEKQRLVHDCTDHELVEQSE